MHRVKRFFLSGKDRDVSAYIRNVFGVTPKNLNLYYQAFRHSSVSDQTGSNNERLEFLGDAVLGAVAAEYLFTKFPFKDEGFLTEIRSRIVNRSSLNQLSIKLGIPDFLEIANDPMLRKGSIYGNSLEAIIGALYLDLGFEKTRQALISRVFRFHLDLDKIESTDSNFKSRLLEWAQREKKQIDYKITEHIQEDHSILYTCVCLIDDIAMGNGKGTSKKRSEQMAAQATIDILGLKND